MICVNFYGGAGVGKSTLAAMVFAALKIKGIRCDLVGEFAKELVYDRAYNIMSDQPYLFAEQAHRMTRMKKYGVQVAICDSPLLLTMAYNPNPNNGRFNALVEETYKDYDNMDYFLLRNEEFWKKDKRSGDITRATQMDKKIRAILESYDIETRDIYPGGYSLAESIADEVEKAVKAKTWPSKGAPLADEPWKVK